MAEFFKAGELVEFAVQIENNGETFYRAAAKKSKKDNVKEVLMYLADGEVKHARIYKDLLKSVETYKPAEVYTEEYFQYLRAYADQHIFVKKTDIEKKAAQLKSDKETIDVGLGAERDSILYYLEMRNFVPDNEKSIVEKIIDEERRHYTKLSEIKKII